jgi:MFS family permease
VILLVLAGLAAAALAVPAAARLGGSWLLASVAVFGGFAFALYPLCVAHTNDHLTAEQRVAASGGLVLAYSAGAAVGPVAGAAAMTALGPAGLFLFIGACAGGALAFALWRQWATAPVPGESQQPYQILPRTTPMSAALDPLAPDES